MWFQHKGPQQIMDDYNDLHPEAMVSLSTVHRNIARGRALLVGTYARNLQALGEVSIARRYGLVDVAWEEMNRIEQSAMGRRDKTAAKKLMMSEIRENLTVVEEMLGVRNQPAAVQNESKTLVVLAVNDDPANRIRAMSDLAHQRILAPNETVIDVPYTS